MTYTPILNAEVDAESPITDLLLTRLRDNPLAVFKNDASVPLEFQLRPLLGTLTTTSGTTQTLSGLDLTPFKSIRAVWNGVSHSATISDRIFRFGGVAISTTVGSSTLRGIIDVDLLDGCGYSIIGNVGVTSFVDVTPRVIETTIVNATTSISVVLTDGTGAFDAGSISIYGVR